MIKTEPPRLATLLLAAGGSRRLGRPKQLVEYAGESLVRRAARLMLCLGASPNVVVTGHRSEDVSKELSGLPLRVVENTRWDQGMGGSIVCGMQMLPADVDGVLLMQCDQWKLDPADLAKLVSVWKTDISRIIIAGWFDGKSDITGPPVIFPRQMMHELECIEKTGGAKPVIDRNQSILRVVPLDNAACDLDKPDDLEKLR